MLQYRSAIFCRIYGADWGRVKQEELSFMERVEKACVIPQEGLWPRGPGFGAAGVCAAGPIPTGAVHGGGGRAAERRGRAAGGRCCLRRPSPVSHPTGVAHLPLKPAST